MNSIGFSVVALGAVILFSAQAQDSRGSIAGKVTDPQGAVVPGAAVLVVNTETNSTSRTASNDSGYFEVNLLNPGVYAITTEARGFKKSVLQGVTLNVAGRLSLDIRLDVGALTEVVEVTGEAPLLDTTTAAGGRVIDNRQVAQLPFSDLNLDFHFRDLLDNLLTSSDTFTHEGFDAMGFRRDEDAPEVDTQWVRNKMSRFSFRSTLR